MASREEYMAVLAAIRQRQRLAEPAKQDRPNLQERNTMQLSDAQIRETIAAAMKPLHERAEAIEAENTALRHALGQFTPEENRAHEAMYLGGLVGLSDTFVGSSFGERSGVTEEQRALRQAGKAVFVLGRAGLREGNWSI